MFLIENARVWRVYAAYTLALIVYSVILLVVAFVVAAVNGFQGKAPGWLDVLVWIMAVGAVGVVLPALPIVITAMWRAARGKD